MKLNIRFANLLVFRALPIVISFLFCQIAIAQFTVTGTVKDAVSNEELIGAAVIIKGTTNGMTTDIFGKFELKIPNNPPVDLKVSFLGYQAKIVTVTKKGEELNILLSKDEVMLKEATVVGTRVEEKLRESPVTIERLGVAEIKQTAAVGFYEGLANLKGVDMTSASLGFKVINTRGFNSTSPVRTLQVIDGMDNQAPGLNFSLGNFVGASEIDVEKVDIVVGANSATYGPNAFNGVIDITTKDPYKYQGLNVSHKMASRSLIESAVRYAHVSQQIPTAEKSGLALRLAEFNNEYLKDRFAYKANFSYLDAQDWQATNYGPTEASLNRIQNNEAGYDGVNIYGESEYPNFTRKYLPFELGVTTLEELNSSKYFQYEEIDGEQVPVMYVYRTGYKEIDLTNYTTYSLKLNGALHYKIPKLGTISYQYNYGNGTTVYQGDNRYSVKDITFNQMKAELKNDDYFIKYYQTTEDAGNSYDLVYTAFKLLQGQKSYEQWYVDFEEGIGEALKQNIDNVDDRLAFARTYADSKQDDLIGTKAMLQPGTPEFERAMQEITSNPSFTTGGTRFQDESSLRHIEGQYILRPVDWWGLLPETFKVGGNYRKFDPNSFGTIFSDTMIVAGDQSQGFTDISTWEWGVYANTQKDIVADKVKLIASLRYDDHQNFNPYFSPAVSGVFTVKKTNNIRLTYSTANRNPTLQDQFLLYDIGVAALKGNLTGYDVLLPEKYFGDEGYLANSNTANFVADNQIRINPVRPENVQSAEIGYKGILLKNVYVDASYYYSQYKDFLGYIVGFIVEKDDADGNAAKVEARPTRISANSNTIVTTQGFSIGLNYFFPQYFSIGANYTYAELLKRDNNDPLIPFFNTPKNKVNLSFGGKDIKNFGFNISYKYVEGFEYFGSPQFTGSVPSYNLVDTQINYNFKDYNTTVKIGASNVLNNEHIEAYGAPLIGRLIYMSLNYEFNKNK